MGLLSQFVARRNVDKAMAIGDLMSPEGRSYIQKLRKHPKPVIARLLNLLGTAGDSEARRIREILLLLLDDNTLSAFVPGLSSNAHPRVINNVSRVLAASRTFDANLLLPLFDKEETSKSVLLKILAARKEGVSALELLRKTSSLSPSERVAMFRILEPIADESLLPELINRITAKDVNTRLGVTRLIARFNSISARNALLGRLSDPSKEVRLVALEALSKARVNLDPRVLCKLLKDRDMQVRNQAIEALVKRNDPAVIPLLIDLLKDESEEVRRAAVEVLNGMEYPDSVQDLLRALKDEDWWVRARAADALAKIGGRRVVEAVIKLLRSDDEYVRRAAIEILNSTKDEAAMEHLLEVLSDSDWWVRERAIDALANIGNKAAIPSLLKLMREDAQAAPIALKAMRTLGSDKHVKQILPMLGTRDDNALIEAMHTLAELVNTDNANEVFTAIKRRALTASEDVREAAKVALRRINTRLAKKRKEKAARDHEFKPRNIIDPNAEGFTKINVRALRTGDMLGDRYEYIRRVGKGAFSTVLLVKDRMLNERIVLKILHDKMANDEAMIKRFIREIRYSRRIQHRNVIRIFDFIAIGNLYAISMEYFASVTLSSMLSPKKPLPFAKALHIAASVASGIGAAHKLRIIHRDLKPGNILIDKSNMVKVVDFGISRTQSAAETQLTKTGILIGTPRYMAPEQVTGKKHLDGRSDIYTLGVILYEMLTGDTAFKGDDNVQVLYRHVHGDIAPLHEANPDVPIELSDIVMKMMSVNPKKRFQTMLEVERVLRTFKLEHFEKQS